MGSSFEISMGDTVKFISELLNTEVDIITDEDRIRPENSEVLRLFASNEKAKRLLDWHPIFFRIRWIQKRLRENYKMVFRL